MTELSLEECRGRSREALNDLLALVDRLERSIRICHELDDLAFEWAGMRNAHRFEDETPGAWLELRHDLGVDRLERVMSAIAAWVSCNEGWFRGDATLTSAELRAQLAR
jgi:hypothetical protein